MVADPGGEHYPTPRLGVDNLKYNFNTDPCPDTSNQSTEKKRIRPENREQRLRERLGMKISEKPTWKQLANKYGKRS